MPKFVLHLMLLDTQITIKLCLLMPGFLFIYGSEGSVIILFVLIVLIVSSPNELKSTMINDAVRAATESEFCLNVLNGVH